jgi:hypothetical protein
MHKAGTSLPPGLVDKVYERNAADHALPNRVRHDRLLVERIHYVDENGRNGLDDDLVDRRRCPDHRFLHRLELTAGENSRFEVGGDFGDC